MDILPASPTNPRIDSLVLEVDRSLAVRKNSIKFVSGVESTSPVPPTLTTTGERRQYRLGNVLRPRGIEIVEQSNITMKIGTSECPYAANALIDLDTFDTLSYKRRTVRGNFLGTSMTAAQKAAIRDGSFAGLYLGDYWTHGGVNWRIVDFDYWMRRIGGRDPVTYIADHHLVIMPDDVRPIQADVRPFTTNRNNGNCGWYYSTTGRNAVDAVVNASKPLFGNGGLLKRSIFWPTTHAGTRYAMNVLGVDGFGSPPSEHMIIGARNLGIPHASTDTQQLALFAQNEGYVWMGEDRDQIGAIPAGRGGRYHPMWLMEVYIPQNWSCHHRDYNSAHDNAQAGHQIRPVFGVTGR